MIKMTKFWHQDYLLLYKSETRAPAKFVRISDVTTCTSASLTSTVIATTAVNTLSENLDKVILYKP